MQEHTLYYTVDDFRVQGFKTTCEDCGKVLGMCQIVNLGVSHVAQHVFTCLDCLQKRRDEGKISDDIPGAREFIDSVLGSGR
jgi:hypothetical protein